MILTLAPVGVTLRIINIRGKDALQKQLNNLGFVLGSELVIVSEIRGNLIVSVKGCRVAIGKDLANRIKVEIV